MAAAELVSHFGNTSIDSPVLETVTTRAFNNLPEAATGSPAVAHSEEITGETSPDTSSVSLARSESTTRALHADARVGGMLRHRSFMYDSYSDFADVVGAKFSSRGF